MADAIFLVVHRHTVLNAPCIPRRHSATYNNTYFNKVRDFALRTMYAM